MVHALETVHRLLNPDGVILNVHDLAESSPIDVRDGERTTRVGELGDDSNYALLHHADDALDQVVGIGLFAMEARKVFAYTTNMDSLKTFDDWLAGTWESTCLADVDHLRLAEATHATRNEAEIIIHRRARMTRLCSRLR